MRHSLIAKSIIFLLLYPLTINSALSKNIDNQLLINQLEGLLNQRKDNLLKAELINSGYRNKKPINLVVSECLTPTFFTQYNLTSKDKVI